MDLIQVFRHKIKIVLGKLSTTRFYQHNLPTDDMHRIQFYHACTTDDGKRGFKKQISKRRLVNPLTAKHEHITVLIHLVRTTKLTHAHIVSKNVLMEGNVSVFMVAVLTAVRRACLNHGCFPDGTWREAHWHWAKLPYSRCCRQPSQRLHCQQERWRRSLGNVTTFSNLIGKYPWP